MAISRFVIGENWEERYPLTAEHQAELEEMGLGKISGWPPYEIIIDENNKIFTRSVFADKNKAPDQYFESLDDNQIMCLCESKAFEVRANMDGATIKCINCSNEIELSW